MKVLIQNITFTINVSFKFNIMQPTLVVFLPMLNLPTLYSGLRSQNMTERSLIRFNADIKSSKFGKGQATAM